MVASSDGPIIQTLRSDLATQIAHHLRQKDEKQSAVARRLGIPQPTLSQVMNGRVSQLSLELLIRIAVRAGLVVNLHIGKDAKDARRTAPRDRVHGQHVELVAALHRAVQRRRGVR